MKLGILRHAPTFAFFSKGLSITTTTNYGGYVDNIEQYNTPLLPQIPECIHRTSFQMTTPTYLITTEPNTISCFFQQKTTYAIRGSAPIETYTFFAQ